MGASEASEENIAVFESFRSCSFPLTEEYIHGAESSLSGLFEQFQIKELQFHWCGLTSSCCDDLCSVITTHHSLTTLDLSHNALGDSGIHLLCEGLRHPTCALQELGLLGCGLTSSCCDDLRSVITTNRSLTSLDLSHNALEDSGIHLLCEGLRQPTCTLQKLSLWNCALTSSCCDDLCSVITTNRSLTRLDLSCNDLQDCAEKLEMCVRPTLELLVNPAIYHLQALLPVVMAELTIKSDTSTSVVKFCQQ
ncbi:NACHT, LRR and PYD domains-containing protein 3-like [Pseudophryne corroboree]|uniref:NACHT, LRR and PYD domains-containing protein 3-like n=1 Tax=Pseudophryne corroboree TaxID=495146 RepID=UPI003081C426